MISKRGDSKKKLLLRRLRAFTPFRKYLIILFVLGLCSSLFFLIGPYFSKLFIDTSFLNKDINSFIKLTIIGSIVFLISILCKTIGDVIKNRIQAKGRLKLSDKFIRKIYSLDLNFFQERSVGENIYRLSDIDRIANFLFEHVPQFLVNIAKFPIILALSFFVDFQLTVFLVLLSPLFLLQSLYIRSKVMPIYEGMWDAAVKLSKRLHESFSKIVIVKALGLEQFERRVYIRLLLKYIRFGLKGFRWSTLHSISSTFLSKTIYGVISLYGGWLIIRGKLTLGSYTAVMLYLTQLGLLLESLTCSINYFVKDAILVEKFFEIIEAESKIKYFPETHTLKSISGEIELRDIWFGYQQERPVFQGLNFSIPAGKWVGIVGPSGCGKTTIISLILKLYDPWSGQILLDGFDLKEIKIESLREKIAVAMQEPFLFDLSIRENICYGLKDVSKKETEDVARLVEMEDFITQLPKGYDTFVGEDGCQLSQGYKQRLALARAIVRRPDLLILDEATSSIDSFTEEKIFMGLREKRRDKATIVVSHRLFTIRHMDRIYFLRDNKHIESGAYDELLVKSDQFRDLFRKQIGSV